MRIRFSDHARHQIKERNLSLPEVKRIVRQPHKVIQQSVNRYRAIRTIAKRKKFYAIVVIYDAQGQTKEIVTAFITSKLNKYL